MNEQDLLNSIENAETVEEVWDAASKAGVDRASFDALVEVAEKDPGDEISDADLENVSGGMFVIPGLLGGYYAGRAARAIYRKIKKIRKDRYQTGYDEEIMSENRLKATCENK